MKLQLNNSGAWKTLINFPVQEVDEVLGKADQLIGHGWRCGDKVTLRVIDSQEQVTHRWTPEEGWAERRPREEWVP